MTLTVGSLFSGVGLLDYGLEQAGMRTVWQVEYDDWCREKLAENFPHTEKFNDVRTVGKHNLKPVDLICGGFPCTDISRSKENGKGLDGKASGLWFEMHRIIRELRPRYALIENVAKLAVFGLDRVLSDLASVGYDAEWQTLHSEAFGLPTVRQRLFVVAVPKSRRPAHFQLFKGNLHSTGKQREIRARTPTIYLEDIGRRIIEIPEHLRVGDGRTFELSEIERAIKGYGNGVAVPVAEWLGNQILRFDEKLTK